MDALQLEGILSVAPTEFLERYLKQWGYPGNVNGDRFLTIGGKRFHLTPPQIATVAKEYERRPKAEEINMEDPFPKSRSVPFLLDKESPKKDKNPERINWAEVGQTLDSSREDYLNNLVEAKNNIKREIARICYNG